MFVNTRRIEWGMVFFLGVSSRENKVGFWREKEIF